MKKFLTVLLALSVVFTYTVGTAFAVTTPTDAEKAAKLSEAKTIAENMVNTYYKDAMENAVDATKSAVTGASGYIAETFEEADFEAAWSKVDVKGLLATKIAEEYVAEAKGFANFVEAEDAATYAAKVFAISTKDTNGLELVASAITTALTTKIAAVGEKQAMLNLYNTEKDDIMSALEKVDYSLYLDTVDPGNADGKTYLQQAQEKVAAAKKTIKDDVDKKMNFDEDTISAANVVSGLAEVTKVVLWNKDTNTSGVVTPILITGTDYESGLYKVVGVDTKADVEAGDREEAATVAEIKAGIQKKYVQVMNQAGADKANADAYVTVCNYLAEKGFITKIEDIPAYGTENWKTPVSQIEELTAFAAKYKAEKDSTGALVRDAKAVDDEVEKATNQVYGTVAGSTILNAIPAAKKQSIDDAEKHIKDMSVKTDAAELAFAKEVAKKALEKARTELADNYYPLEIKKIEAKYADILAEIEAATTTAKVTTAKNKIADATNGINDKKAVDSAIVWSSGAAKADLEDVDYQVSHLNKGKTILDAGYIDATEAQMKTALAKIYGEAGARTDKEIKALKTDTVAVAAALPTVGAKAAAKKAVEDAINALPAKATEADLAAVEAAVKAVTEYEDLGGTVETKLVTKLTTAKEQVKTDMLKNLTIAYAQLDKTDKAAVKALKEKIETAVELVKKDNALGDGNADGTMFNTLNTNIITTLNAIRTAELNTVIKAINAIPLNITLEDKSIVEAARATYDAFVEEWNDYGTPSYDAASAVGVGKYKELALAEAAISILDSESAIKATEALKIKTSTKLYKGKKIQVKWRIAGGDASKITGYQVWKSTKANSGYKFMGKTKKLSMDNKKGLVKGKRYFYKVRAYVDVDGDRYYSDWSNKGNRIYKK